MKVKFVPQNIELETTPEKTLLQLAMDNGIEIKSLCKGVPSCAECRIRILEGESNVMPPNRTELSLIGTNYYIDSRRLACQVRCFGPVTIDMTEQLARQENNTKKIRGFRSEKPQESIAVLDTMLLTEKPSDPQPQANLQAQPRNQRKAPQAQAVKGPSQGPKPITVVGEKSGPKALEKPIPNKP